MSTRPVNLWASLLFVALVWALELPPIGWQLFILGSSQSDSTAFPSFLDTYATCLLAEPLRGGSYYPVTELFPLDRRQKDQLECIPRLSSLFSPISQGSKEYLGA